MEKRRSSARRVITARKRPEMLLKGALQIVIEENLIVYQ
jgi:hypothetical protein